MPAHVLIRAPRRLPTLPPALPPGRTAGPAARVVTSRCRAVRPVERRVTDPLAPLVALLRMLAGEASSAVASAWRTVTGLPSPTPR